MLLISDIAWTIMKIVYVGFTFVYKDTLKFSDTFRNMGRKYLKRILTYLYCNKWNKINIYHSDTQKHVSYKKWYKCYKYFVYRLSQKFSDPNGEMFKVYFNILILH